jgi:phosphoribosylanthranilate isomerase
MTKVKICGITNLEDALAAVDCGADALGFVFAPSPRQVTPAAVKEIVGQLPTFVCRVGVFVSSELTQVQETMAFCSLALAQLHGDEDPDYCSALSPRAIKVFTASNLPSGKDLVRYRVAAYMLDRDKGVATSDAQRDELWQLAREIGNHGPVILAGGLTPDNVGQAIEVARPYAVDVSSGVEREPGRKDHRKLRAFIEAARQARPEGSGSSLSGHRAGAQPLIFDTGGRAASL